MWYIRNMKLTKLGHACVRLQKDGRTILIDPGTMTEASGLFDGAEAVLVTHEHFDHLDRERLIKAFHNDPRLTIYTPAGTAQHLASLGDRVHVVGQGDRFSVAGFEVVVVGEKHHVSHPDVPPVDNVGFFIDQEVFHPGDALTGLDGVPTLLVPGQAPWMTVPDLIRYLRAMAPQRAYAIHDGLLNEWGLGLLDSVLAAEAERSGADFRRMAPLESVEL